MRSKSYATRTRGCASNIGQDSGGSRCKEKRLTRLLPRWSRRFRSEKEDEWLRKAQAQPTLLEPAAEMTQAGLL